MLDSERDRIFGEWLAAHKGINRIKAALSAQLSKEAEL